MEQVGEAVAPVLLHAAPDRDAPRQAVVHVGVERGGAECRDALARGDAVLELLVGQLLAHHAVGLVEPAHLPVGAVGHEVHGVLAVAHRQRHRVIPARADRVERHQLGAGVRLELPPRVEPAEVVELAHVRGAHEGRVGHGDAPDAGVARAGERAGAERQLLDPLVLDPDALPRRRELRRSRLRGALAAEPQFQRAAHHLGAHAELVRGTAHQVVGKRERHVVVEHQAVPLGPERPHRGVRLRALPRRHEGAHLVAPHPPAHRQRVGVEHGDRQVGPVDVEVEVQHGAEPLSGDEQHAVAEHQLARAGWGSAASPRSRCRSPA